MTETMWQKLAGDNLPYKATYVKSNEQYNTVIKQSKFLMCIYVIFVIVQSDKKKLKCRLIFEKLFPK